MAVKAGRLYMGRPHARCIRLGAGAKCANAVARRAYIGGVRALLVRQRVALGVLRDGPFLVNEEGGSLVWRMFFAGMDKK